MKIFKFLTVCTIAIILTGCACFNTVSVTTHRTTTTGQELIDLQKAKDSGAITEEEYDTNKEKILKRVEAYSVIFKSEPQCKKH